MEAPDRITVALSRCTGIKSILSSSIRRNDKTSNEMLRIFIDIGLNHGRFVRKMPKLRHYAQDFDQMPIGIFSLFYMVTRKNAA
ncbi:hypothetical protein [Paenochrobactrum glaciei]|uniref:hypothetical protein n=1 Tax=Paenochrobactrum glaciei TaxID=486407 RepID=UPI0031E298E0